MPGQGQQVQQDNGIRIDSQQRPISLAKYVDKESVSLCRAAKVANDGSFQFKRLDGAGLTVNDLAAGRD